MLRDFVGDGLACILIARPSSTQHVASIVTLCKQYEVAVIPQGGNTNVPYGSSHRRQTFHSAQLGPHESDYRI